MLARDALKAQGVLAFRALAKEVRFAVAEANAGAAYGGGDLVKQVAKGNILSAALCDVAREKAKERVSEEEKV